jgi:hypothetical protein
VTPQRVAAVERETEVWGQTGVGPTNSPWPRVTLAHTRPRWRDRAMVGARGVAPTLYG